MSGIIYTGETTKLAHGYFIAWLNGLLGNYQAGFYDEAISNIIQLSFIKKHSLYLQELYTEDGETLTNFISVVPTDSVSPILMIHGLDGIPVLYNKTTISNIFEFTTEGWLNKFYENVVVDLKNSAGVSTHELFIYFKDNFGIKTPYVKLKNKSSGLVISKGLLDMDFQTRYSGSYNVETVPFNDLSYFLITNVSKMGLTTDIPILPNLAIRYRIEINDSVRVVNTPMTDNYIRNNMDTTSFKYRFIEVPTV